MRYDIVEPSSPYYYGQNQLATYQHTHLAGNAKHILMWSGGTDSTLLLYELLNMYGAENVVAISYKYPWLLESKWEQERLHRTAFITLAKLRGLGTFKHMELTISQNDIIGSPHYLQANPGSGLPQAVAWMLSVPIYAENGSYIYDGGIRGDDLTLRLGAYHEMFKGMTGVMQKDLTLREPYLYLTKEDILEKIIGYDLYEHCWFCETPEGEHPCCNCVPCRTHMAALDHLVWIHKGDLIGQKAEHYLSNLRLKINDTPPRFRVSGDLGGKEFVDTDTRSSEDKECSPEDLKKAGDIVDQYNRNPDTCQA